MVRSVVENLLTRLRNSQNAGPVILATTVGLLAGFGAILFRYLIIGIKWLFFDGFASLCKSLETIHLGQAYIVLAPAIGLVIVSWIVIRWAPEAKGHGVPEVQYAVRRQGGRIRPRIAIVKSIASALSIGSGCSVGREGPIVQIGCSLGSTIAQFLKLQESGVRLLVACGAAGAIGATFNAPIAGVLFALEVILESFAARSFGVVVISSVTATAVSRAFLGEEPAFALLQSFSLQSLWEFPLYLVLGAIAGVIALGYVRSVYLFEDAFEGWKIPEGVKALLGGLAVGLIGFTVGEGVSPIGIFGVGYEGIEQALNSKFTVSFLLLLLVLKILATSLTLGAGGSGGVFAPALFIGAMLGSAFGLTVNGLFPGITAPAGAYALVGMAALFAGAAHAPITSILILFEMTDDYKIILPLMLASVVSYLIAAKLSPDSIYTIKLRRRGGYVPPRTEVSVLDRILVVDVMTTEYQTVPPELPASELASVFHGDLVRSCPVLDAEGQLVGIVTEFDLEKAEVEGGVEQLTVADLMTTDLVTCTPDEMLRAALGRFSKRDIHQIPVTDKKDPKKLLGVLRRAEALWDYSELLAEHEHLLARTGVGLPAASRDSVQMEVHVKPEHSKLTFKKIRDIEAPDQCVIAILRRGERAVIPRGDTVIEPGDFLVLLTTHSHESSLRHWIAEFGNGD